MILHLHYFTLRGSQTTVAWMPDLPEDIVNAHNALGLGVATVVDHGSVSFHPDVASSLGEHSVLTTHCLPLGTY